MDRRTLLRRAGVAGGALLAGCMGSKPDQDTSLSVANVDFYENDDGFVEVAVIVTNAGNERESGTLLVHATVNGDAMSRVREVALDPHATQEVLVTYDVRMADVQSMSVDATIQR